jgi:hypothetical protein
MPISHALSACSPENTILAMIGTRGKNANGYHANIITKLASLLPFDEKTRDASISARYMNRLFIIKEASFANVEPWA